MFGCVLWMERNQLLKSAQANIDGRGFVIEVSASNSRVVDGTLH